MASALLGPRGRIDMSAIEKSLGIRWERGLFRHSGRYEYEVHRDLGAALKPIVKHFSTVSDPKDLRGSTELRDAVDKVFDSIGLRMWPRLEDDMDRKRPDWLASAEKNDLDGLYPRDLVYAVNQDRQQLQTSFHDLVIAKCFNFVRNHLSWKLTGTAAPALNGQKRKHSSVGASGMRLSLIVIVRLTPRNLARVLAEVTTRLGDGETMAMSTRQSDAAGQGGYNGRLRKRVRFNITPADAYSEPETSGLSDWEEEEGSTLIEPSTALWRRGSLSRGAQPQIDDAAAITIIKDSQILRSHRNAHGPDYFNGKGELHADKRAILKRKEENGRSLLTLAQQRSAVNTSRLDVTKIRGETATVVTGTSENDAEVVRAGTSTSARSLEDDQDSLTEEVLGDDAHLPWVQNSRPNRTFTREQLVELKEIMVRIPAARTDRSLLIAALTKNQLAVDEAPGHQRKIAQEPRLGTDRAPSATQEGRAAGLTPACDEPPLARTTATATLTTGILRQTLAASRLRDRGATTASRQSNMTHSHLGQDYAPTPGQETSITDRARLGGLPALESGRSRRLMRWDSSGGPRPSASTQASAVQSRTSTRDVASSAGMPSTPHDDGFTAAQAAAFEAGPAYQPPMGTVAGREDPQSVPATSAGGGHESQDLVSGKLAGTDVNRLDRDRQEVAGLERGTETIVGDNESHIAARVIATTAFAINSHAAEGRPAKAVSEPLGHHGPRLGLALPDVDLGTPASASSVASQPLAEAALPAPAQHIHEPARQGGSTPTPNPTKPAHSSYTAATTASVARRDSVTSQHPRRPLSPISLPGTRRRPSSPTGLRPASRTSSPRLIGPPPVRTPGSFCGAPAAPPPSSSRRSTSRDPLHSSTRR
ncbi:hypothetical protein LTR53_010939 [Teratosphaeriaceae sp. CCFEE 6253]|nr:hypothetical protein LTR53_010939 [Teratosphaeriaceae sp. CCFEE 6253]